jgi:5-methylcytosine-specific restriction endonuclease McrA
MEDRYVEQKARCSRSTDREPDGVWSPDSRQNWSHPYWLCDACEESTLEPFVVGDEIILCDSCAGAVANYWHHSHSGEYITWPNPSYGSRSKNDNRSSISHRKRKRIHERDAYRCRYCGSYEDLVLDHVFPVSRGGTNDDSNLVTACSECNSKKSDNTPEEAGMELKPAPNEDSA